MHLAILVLAAALLRLAVENFRKYGLLLSVPGKNISLLDWLCALAVGSVLVGHYSAAFWLEKRMSCSGVVRRRSGRSAPKARSVDGCSPYYYGYARCRALNALGALLLPALIVWAGVRHPGLGALLVSLSIICAMKVASYHAVLADVRRHGATSATGFAHAPDCSHCLLSPVSGADVSPSAVRLDFAMDGLSEAAKKRKLRRNSDTASHHCDGTPSDATSACIRSAGHSRRTSQVQYAIDQASPGIPHGQTFSSILEVPSRRSSVSDTDLSKASAAAASASLSNLQRYFFFVVAPTLCYQPEYPRNVRIRWGFLLGILLQLTVDLAAIHLLFDQYAVPTLRNSEGPINARDYFGMLERLLKLSLSSLLIWLFAFHALFHCVLNASAELNRFADRGFYRAWWNASTVGEYWRLWNMPVHSWLRRHVYAPLVERGLCAFFPCGTCCNGKATSSLYERIFHAPWNASAAQLACFAISAVAHEYIVAVPTHMLEGWAFLAMLLQVPIIMFERPLRRRYFSGGIGHTLGNVFFWLSFCIVGQPACVLLYYRAWCIRTSSQL